MKVKVNDKRFLVREAIQYKELLRCNTPVALYQTVNMIRRLFYKRFCSMKFKSALIIVALLLAGYFLYGYVQKHSGTAQQAMGGMPVSVAKVEQKKVTLWQNFSGRFVAVDSVEIKPRISGTIDAIHFKDGDVVTKDQLLFTIDPKPYEAALRQAEAMLASAQNDARFAKVELERAAKLVKDKVVTKSDYDNRLARSRVADANVKSAQAAVEVAELNLGYTQIKAPIAGRISRAEITLGNLVETNTGAPVLTRIVSQDPIYVDFEADERTFLALVSKVGMTNLRQVPVEVGVSGDAAAGYKGIVSSFDNQINSVSGTIRVRAQLDNKEGKLIPGMFASVRMGSALSEDAILITDRAVGTDQDKKFVLKVNAENKVEYQPVVLGVLSDGLRVVLGGLKSGDKIVVSGLQRVRPGDAVTPEMVPMDPREKPAVPPATPAAPAEAK
jgi:multidrug efflux system membrane fusion protein